MFHGSHLLASMGWIPKYGLEGQCGKTCPFCEFLVDILLQQQPYHPIWRAFVSKGHGDLNDKSVSLGKFEIPYPPRRRKKGWANNSEHDLFDPGGRFRAAVATAEFHQELLGGHTKTENSVCQWNRRLSTVPTFCYKHKTYSQTLAELNWLFHGLIFQVLLPLALEPWWLGRPGI